MFVCAEWVAIDDIAKAGDSIMYAHILLLTDGSELSKMAIREGVDLGESSGGPIQETHGRTAQYLDVAKKIAAAAGIPCDGDFFRR